MTPEDKAEEIQEQETQEQEEQEEKKSEEQATRPAPRKKALNADPDLDGYIEKHVKNLYREIETGRYIECSTCGDKILRKNGTCKRCGMKYDPKKSTWVKDAPEVQDTRPPWLRG